jgi:DNA polymerase type B, organellar and viral
MTTKLVNYRRQINLLKSRYGDLLDGFDQVTISRKSNTQQVKNYLDNLKVYIRNNSNFISRAGQIRRLNDIKIDNPRALRLYEQRYGLFNKKNATIIDIRNEVKKYQNYLSGKYYDDLRLEEMKSIKQRLRKVDKEEIMKQNLLNRCRRNLIINDKNDTIVQKPIDIMPKEYNKLDTSNWNYIFDKYQIFIISRMINKLFIENGNVQLAYLQGLYAYYEEIKVKKIVMNKSQANNLLAMLGNIYNIGDEYYVTKRIFKDFRYTESIQISRNKILNGNNDEYVQSIREVDKETGKYTTKEVIKSELTTPKYNDRVMIVGYKIFFQKLNDNIDESNNVYNSIRAFKPTSLRKYHEQTTSSTSLDKLCIYETVLDIFDIIKLSYRRQNRKTSDEIKEKLSNEPKKIQESIKQGKLFESLINLSRTYRREILLIFFNSKYKSGIDMPILFKNGKYEEIIKLNDYDDIRIKINDKYEFNEKGIELNNKLNSYNGKKCVLYDGYEHVAPSIFKNDFYNIICKNSIEKPFFLRNEILGDYNNKNLINENNEIKLESMPYVKGLLGFDTETYRDKDKNCIIYNITLFGELNGEKIKKSFYGCNKNSAKNKFHNYLQSIVTYRNTKKSHEKNAIKDIYIYGFNNSKFDNLLFYKSLFDTLPTTKFIFCKNSLKSIIFGNIRIYDISLIYSGMGGLRETCKSFGLEKEKGVFPYDFPNENNLNYIGEVPELKYWNSKKDMDEYINKNGNIFNMKEYTEKYCLLDSELVYELGKIHFKNCIGEINNRYYNILKCPTAANMSIKIFTQCFLDEFIYESNGYDSELESYKAGRTEVFQQEFISDNVIKYLYVVDINSAHPASMRNIMPFQFKKKITYKEEKKLIYDEIVDYNLYYIRTEYKGNNKYYIQNLLYRTDDNKLLAFKNMPYGWHWGAEIKRCLKNGSDIYCKEIQLYRGKVIFKDFVEYFYNERLKHKKSNPSYANFLKLILNSLYGKFGQKPFANSVLCKCLNDFFKKHDSNNSSIECLEDIDEETLLVSYINKKTDKNIGRLVRFSSYIAALTRCNLDDIIVDCGYENVYYCDTDSVFTTKIPNENLMSETELGKCKIEAIAISARFLAPKSYTYNYINDINDTKIKEKNKCKGIKLDGIKSEQIEKLYEDYKNGIQSSLSKEDKMFYRSYRGVKIDRTTRNLKPIYNKRIFKNGKSIAFNDLIHYNELNV